MKRAAAQQGEEQRDGVIRDRVDAVVGDVADRDSEFGGRLDIDVVVADAVTDHDRTGASRPGRAR